MFDFLAYENQWVNQIAEKAALKNFVAPMLWMISSPVEF